MKHCQIVFDLLFPPDEEPPKAVQPRMRSFHDPTTRSVAQDSFLILRFFTTRTDMRCVAELFYQLLNLRVIISLVQTQVLGCLLRWLRPFHNNAFQRRANQLHIMTISSRYGHTHGDTLCFSKQTSLGARLTPVSRIGTRSFFPPAGLWSSPHPSLAIPNPGLSVGRTRAVQFATSYMAKNYSAPFKDFEATGLTSHLFIAVGDDEWPNPEPENYQHDLDFEAHVLYNRSRRVRNLFSELRVVDGGHSWLVWRPTFFEGIKYAFNFLEKPV